MIRDHLGHPCNTVIDMCRHFEIAVEEEPDEGTCHQLQSGEKRRNC